jgi:hypothetical protein
MRKMAALVLVLVVAGCGSTSTPNATPTPQTAKSYSAPTNCELQGVIDAFAAQVPGSKYVPTQWQPSKGTDLYDAIQSGGIACTYGIQVAEVGGTVLWGNLTQDQWNLKKAGWLFAGQLSIDLPGIDEASATILKEGSTGADERHIWGVNLYVNGIWIQVNASFLQTVDEALPIIQAAISAAQAN